MRLWPVSGISSSEGKSVFLLNGKRSDIQYWQNGLISRDVDIDLFHRREIRHRVGAVRAVVRVPQGGRDAPGGEFLSGETGHYQRPLVLKPFASAPELKPEYTAQD